MHDRSEIRDYNDLFVDLPRTDGQVPGPSRTPASEGSPLPPFPEATLSQDELDDVLAELQGLPSPVSER
jgi:hypothetical protein